MRRLLPLVALVAVGCGSPETRTMPQGSASAAPTTPPYLQNNPNLSPAGQKAVAGAVVAPPNGSPSANATGQ